MTILRHLILGWTCLVLVVGGSANASSNTDFPRSGPDYTAQLSSIFQAPMFKDRLLVVDREVIYERDEKLAVVAPFGEQFALPPETGTNPWTLFFLLQAYRMKPPTFAQSLQLSDHVFDARSRQVVLNMLGINKPEATQSAKAFRKVFSHGSDEFQRSDFHTLMKRTYGQDKPFRGHVKILNLKTISLQQYDVSKQELLVRETSRLFGSISSASKVAMPDHELRESWKMDENTARYVVRHLKGNGYGGRTAYLAIRGTLYFPGELKKPLAFFPEEIAIYYDSSYVTPIMVISVTDLFRDKSAERLRAQQAEHAAEAAEQAALLAEQRQLQTERAAAAARISARPLDILGVRLGMSEQEARSQLAGTSAAFQIAPTQSFDDNPPEGGSLSPSPCQVHRGRMRREMTALLRSLSRDVADSGGLSAEQQQVLDSRQAELIAAMPNECRPRFDPFASYLTATASYAEGKIEDNVIVYFGHQEMNGGTVAAVVRRLKMNRVELNVAKKLTEKLGTDFYAANDTVRYWMNSPVDHFRVIDDESFRNLCIPWLPWPVEYNRFSVGGFRTDCKGVLGAQTDPDSASLFLVDTTHLTKIRKLREQSVEAEKHTPVDVDF
ncbi:hypothetical protein LCL97_22005 [Seohaeicola saemankumensis]|nr:hypothetical protein [Seohaeicola saemankumensis]MCA0873514.1 hypothetical protein [Seohaeicola saemankumensis]